MVSSTDARDLFRRAKGKAGPRARSAQKKATRWIWAKGNPANAGLLPFEEVFNPTGGKHHRSEPKRKGQGTHAVAFDAKDRLVLKRVYFTNEAFTETLYLWRRDSCDWTRFRHDGALIAVGVAALGSHGATELRELASNHDAETHTTVTYEGDKPRSAEIVRVSRIQPETIELREAIWDGDRLARLTSRYATSANTRVLFPKGD